MMISRAVIPVFVSGLALASAFSVVPPSPPATIRSGSNHLAFARSQEISAPSSSSSSSRRTSLSVSASTGAAADAADAAETAKPNSGEIYLLDEVDSIFEAIDADGDGAISKDELNTHLFKMGYTSDYTGYLFDSIDNDSNGSISREELRLAFYNFEAIGMYMTLGMGGAEITSRKAFRRLVSRSTSEQEAADDPAAAGGPSKRWDKLLLDDLADLVFDIVDADKSGEITPEELKAHFDGVAEKLVRTSKNRREAAASARQAREYVETILEALDADRNGTICRDEIRAAFQKYDFKLLVRSFGWTVYQSPLE